MANTDKLKTKEEIETQATARGEKAIAELERSRAETEARLAEVRLQAAELELEDLQARVADRRQKNVEREARHAAAQQSLEKANEDIIASQKVCKHKKGGKNKGGLINGHDHYYSVFTHTYPWGSTVVMCTRCTREWRMPTAPDTALKRADPAKWKAAVLAYKTALEEYNEALNWPTDNEPSGTQLFEYKSIDPRELAAQAELAAL